MIKKFDLFTLSQKLLRAYSALCFKKYNILANFKEFKNKEPVDFSAGLCVFGRVSDSDKTIACPAMLLIQNIR